MSLIQESKGIRFLSEQFSLNWKQPSYTPSLELILQNILFLHSRLLVAWPLWKPEFPLRNSLCKIPIISSVSRYNQLKKNPVKFILFISHTLKGLCQKQEIHWIKRIMHPTMINEMSSTLNHDHDTVQLVNWAESLTVLKSMIPPSWWTGLNNDSTEIHDTAQLMIWGSGDCAVSCKWYWPLGLALL